MVEFAKPSTKCFSVSTYVKLGLFNSVVNISTDVLFAILPIPVIWNLQIGLRAKISLGFVLSLGFSACAAGIIKTRLQIVVITEPDPWYHDSFGLWNMLELCLGILAASLPSLKPLFAAALEGTRSRLCLSSPSRSRRAPTGGRPTSGFRRHYDPRSLDDVDLSAWNGGTIDTVIHSSSAASSGDLGVSSESAYEVNAAGGGITDQRAQWQTLGDSWAGSEERLHWPMRSPSDRILRKVEMSHTSETGRYL